MAHIYIFHEKGSNGILDKDIITDRSKINRQNFEKIATYVMANAGKEFSVKNIGSYFENLNEEQIDKKLFTDTWIKWRKPA